MFKTYLKAAFRNLAKNKLFSLINVAGLALGISASLVIYLIVQHEFSYDRNHPNSDRLFRVVSKIEFKDLTIRNGGVPVPTYDAAKREVPGIEKATHFITVYNIKAAVPTGGSPQPIVFREQKDVLYADNEYFNIFNYRWLAGTKETALQEPFKVVLTSSRAKTYFANLNPSEIIGRQVVYDDSITATITGVVEDIQQPSDLRFAEFISRATVENTGIKNHWSWNEWGSINSSSNMFVLLKPGVDPHQVTTQLAVLRQKYRDKTPENANRDDTKHFLQRLEDIHFNADYDNFDGRQAHLPTLYGLLAVAAFLLLLGCINFINLTTAQSSQRAREIGIRKTMGSGKRQLMMQFLGETLVLTFFATVVSVILTPWLLNIFSDFIPPGVSFATLNQPHVWLFLLGTTLIVAFLAGFYPALVLTRFKPVTVLKNQAFSGTSQTRKAWLRKTLTVTQFVIAQFLLIATLVVSKQVRYSLNKDLGFKKDAIVSFNVPRNFYSKEVDNRRFALIDKLKTIPGIEKISLAGSTPASPNTNTTSMKFNEEGMKPYETMVEVKTADTNYFSLFKMKLIGGRNLLPSDTTKEFVINETYARQMGFTKPAEAVGHFIDRGFKVPIVGVLADFHTKSTHEAIKPLAYSAAALRNYSIHLALRENAEGKNEWKETIAKTEAAFKALYPEDAFKFEFFDKGLAQFYKAETNISRLLQWSAALCIFISCLGLLGLVIYVTNTRTKEIGVRKVLGASVLQLVSLLSKDFVLLVLVAFVITIPVGWWVMNNWLQDFVYRTDLSWWVFGVTGGGMIAIAVLILSARTVKSALENPVKSLRTE